MERKSIDDLINEAAEKLKDPQQYAERVMRSAERAFAETGMDEIEIDTSAGKVKFQKDPAAGMTKVFVNGQEIPQKDIALKFAEIDKPEKEYESILKPSVASIAKDAKTQITRKSVNDILSMPEKQAKSAEKTTNTILHSLMRYLGLGIHR